MKDTITVRPGAYRTFASRLLFIRTQLGLTQQAFAARARINKRALLHLETGRANTISLEILQRVTDFVTDRGVLLEWWIRGKGPIANQALDDF